jgi:hypothetical protein
MNNTKKLDLFREGVNPEVVLLPLSEKPAELGGPKQQRLTTHFKVNEDYSYEEWAPKALLQLAQMITYSFPSAIQFYQLETEDNIIEDPEICIREFHREMPEEWSEPAEDLNEEQLAAFVPRKKWDAHTKVTFEVIFQFEQPCRMVENPETD